MQAQDDPGYRLFPSGPVSQQALQAPEGRYKAALLPTKQFPSPFHLREKGRGSRGWPLAGRAGAAKRSRAAGLYLSTVNNCGIDAAS